MRVPTGKKAAIYLTIDDVHPGTSKDLYEAGGDLSEGVLGHVEWLLERHPQLKVTLFVTADWRETYPYPTRKLLSSIPGLREHCYLSPLRRKGKMALSNHGEFVKYLNSLERVTIGLHGLHHVTQGPYVPAELNNKNVNQIEKIVDEMVDIFEKAGLEYIPCFAPPGWECDEKIVDPLLRHDVRLIMSGRDVLSEVAREAKIEMSGLKGVSLIYPESVFHGRLLHLPSNFHATCPIDRAIEIIELGGVVGIKAHIIKKAGSLIARDGLDETYRNYLDLLLFDLEQRYSDDLWWTDVYEFGQFQWT
jgi:hypothetical protein